MCKQFQRDALSKVFATNLCLVLIVVFSRLGDVDETYNYKHADNALQEVFFFTYVFNNFIHVFDVFKVF